jgi:hypothetical protein
MHFVIIKLLITRKNERRVGASCTPSAPAEELETI